METTSSKIPPNWEKIILKDYVNINARIGWRGLKRSEYTKSGPLLLAVKNICTDGSIDITDTDHLSKFRYEESPEIKLRENDILITKDGTIGKIGFVEKVGVETTVNSSILVVRPCEAILPKYLFYYFRGPGFQKIVSGKITGSAVPHLFQKDIKKFQLKIPPLAEQERIVAKLDEILPKLRNAQERLDKVPELLRQFRQSVLNAGMSGDLTVDWRKNNPDIDSMVNLLKKVEKQRIESYDGKVKLAKVNGKKKPKKDFPFIIYEDQSRFPTWIAAKLDNLIYISARIGWRGLKADEYTEIGPLFLSVHSLNYGETVDFRDAYHLSQERYDESPEIQLKENDILLAKDGAGIGKIGFVKTLPGPATVNSSLLVIRGKELFIPKFLFYFLSGPRLQNIAKQRITGTATPHLFQKDIKQFVLHIPPLEEQEEIVNQIEKLFEIADKVEDKYKLAKSYVDSLEQSILAKAFRGELVPQDPNDEPASELLKRIHPP